MQYLSKLKKSNVFKVFFSSASLGWANKQFYPAKNDLVCLFWCYLAENSAIWHQCYRIAYIGEGAKWCWVRKILLKVKLTWAAQVRQN